MESLSCPGNVACEEEEGHYQGDSGSHFLGSVLENGIFSL